MHSIKAAPQFFSFRVRNLPDYLLAMVVSEVEVITEAVEISPIPLAPPSVYGICYWDNQVVTVLDLAATLCAGSAPASLRPHQRLIIAKVPVPSGFQYIGWPIEGSASITQFDGMVYHTTIPLTFASKLVEESVSIDNDQLLILRLTGLFD